MRFIIKLTLFPHFLKRRDKFLVFGRIHNKFQIELIFFHRHFVVEDYILRASLKASNQVEDQHKAEGYPVTQVLVSNFYV